MPFDPRNFNEEWNIEAEPDYFDPEQQVNMRAASPSRFLQPDLNGPDNQTFEDWMQEYLNLDTSRNFYDTGRPLNVGLLPSNQRAIANPLQNANGAQNVQLPQVNQQPQEEPEVIQDRKIFNNFPGFLTGAIQTFGNEINFNQLQTYRYDIINQVREASKKLKDVMMKLSSKEGNRQQLMMLLNKCADIGPKIRRQLKKKENKNKGIKKYFELQDTYGNNIMDEAKNQMREAIRELMTKTWMDNHAGMRNFGGNNVDLKRRIFFKYMVYFTKQLQVGEIQAIINKKSLMRIPPLPKLKESSSPTIRTSFTHHLGQSLIVDVNDRL